MTYGLGLNFPNKIPWLEKHGYLLILAATAADAIQHKKELISFLHYSFNDSNFPYVINALWCLTFIFKLLSDQRLHKKAANAYEPCFFSGERQAADPSTPTGSGGVPDANMV